MTQTNTTAPTITQSRFDEALTEYLRERDRLEAMPVETTSREDEGRAMEAMAAAERRLFNKTPQTVSDVRALAEIAWRDPDSLPDVSMIGAVINGLRQIDGNAPSRTFEPDSWLRNYERLGGGWTNVEGEVSLLAPVPTPEGLQAMLWELDTRGGREQVKAAIRSLPDGAITVPASVRWQSLCRAYDEAAEAMKAHEAIKNPHRYDSPECEAHEAETERLAIAEGEAFDAMMLHPAPDTAALAFKLAAQSSFTKGQHWPTADKIAARLAADAATILPKVA